MPDDRHRILQRLQSALRSEHLAVASYRLHAERADELNHKFLARKLNELAASHGKHIIGLEERIEELGGKPAAVDTETYIQHSSLEHDDLCFALEQNLKAEDMEIEEYEILARQSDEKTIQMCEQNIEENRRHLAWLRAQIVKGRNLDSLE